MRESITTRNEHAQLEEDVRSLRRFRDSTHFQGRSDANRDRLDAQIADTETKCAAAKLKLNEMVNELIESDFWPIMRQDDVSSRWIALLVPS